MSDGFAYIDILFFAMVAAFIAFRLRSVLGRRTGHERRRTPGWQTAPNDNTNDKVVPLPDRSRPAADAEKAFASIRDEGLKRALTSIRMADPSFDLDSFLPGAKAAFEMIVEAYATGNKEALRPLLADDVLGGFVGAIEEREAAGQTLETQLIAVHQADVVDAELQGSLARVTVKFTSEQVNVLRDASGEVVDGDPKQADEVVDVWTFERDTRSSDPNWTLVETRTPD
jgi:predicted lipid-binding transport protein (Tim44 family)